MAQSSPGVRRVAAILNFFADHPGQAFTLTDLMRALKLSRATCHALLAGLVEVGYLYRSSDKSYVFGPALMNIARVAAEHSSPLQIAQPEMRALADEFDAVCAAFSLDRDDVVVRERAASRSFLGWSAPPGARLKLRPPFGAVFYSWRPTSEAEAWLDASDPPPTPQQRETMLQGMAFAREHGFLFGVQNTSYTGAADPPEMVFGGRQTDFPAALLTELKPDQEYRLTFALAPVFDVRSEVAFVIGILNVTSLVTGAEVERIGQRLREACARVTTFMAGSRPGPARA